MIFIETDGEIVRVSAENIMYAESFAHHLELAATTGIIKAKIPLYELEQKLGENFVRCHRSYIVGLKYISKITKTDVILDNGKSIPLSRRLYSSVNNEFIKYFTGDE